MKNPNNYPRCWRRPKVNRYNPNDPRYNDVHKFAAYLKLHGKKS